jgi:hypothetical protein
MSSVKLSVSRHLLKLDAAEEALPFTSLLGGHDDVIAQLAAPFVQLTPVKENAHRPADVEGQCVRLGLEEDHGTGERNMTANDAGKTPVFALRLDRRQCEFHTHPPAGGAASKN